MFRTWKRFAVVSALVLCLGMHSGVVFGQGKGGGGGGGGGKPPKDDPPAAPVNYQITWLGTLGGSGRVNDMNSSGTLVGVSATSAGLSRAIRIIPALDGDGNLVYWQDANGDGMNDLMENLNDVMNVPAGWVAYIARGISDNGVIAGAIGELATGISHVFVYDPADGSFVDITPDVPGNAYTEAGINNNAEVAGRYYDASGEWRSFLYTAGQLFDIGAFEPHDISNSGQITGVTYTGEGGFRYTYSYDPLTQQLAGSLETFPETSIGLSINDAGTFVGSTTTPEPYRFVNGQLEILPNQRGGGAEGVNALNDVCGDVAGKGKNPGGPFLYTDADGMLMLNDLIVGAPADVDQWLNSGNGSYLRMAHEPWLLSDGSVFSPMFGQMYFVDMHDQPFVLLPVPVPSP